MTFVPLEYLTVKKALRFACNFFMSDENSVSYRHKCAIAIELGGLPFCIVHQ